jgi:hypothetical protein
MNVARMCFGVSYESAARDFYRVILGRVDGALAR